MFKKNAFPNFILHNINIQYIQTLYLIMGCMVSHHALEKKQTV